MTKTAKPLVYIASPYTKGDPAINTYFQCRVFNELMDDGIVLPFVPLWSHFQHLLFPRDYRDWIRYDLEILPKMDALLRLNAEHAPLDYVICESSGADGEVQFCKSHGIPVYYNKQALYEWAIAWQLKALA